MKIDLDESPATRWAGLAERGDLARRLLALYRRDLGSGAENAGLVETIVDQVARREEPAELTAIAQSLGVPRADVVLCNAYYDLIKASVGCSAFAIDTPAGPLHARNLDWWTSENLLRDGTMSFDCQRAGRTRYRLVGWPGFIGCFSGVAPGRFAVTLNAVLSDDAPQIAEPVVFLLRRTLDEAADFDAAVKALEQTPIASDCLLLVTGVRAGELVVIERTPTRAALRRPVNGRLIVTNDYRALGAGGAVGELGATSCGRYDRVAQLLDQGFGDSVERAFTILTDPKVKMTITVQQMVLRASDGTCVVRLPGD